MSKVIIDLFDGNENLVDFGLQARKGHDFVSGEHFRVFWEVAYASNKANSLFSTLYNGSGFSMFYTPLRDIVEYSSKNNRAIYNTSTTFRNKSYHRQCGIGYGKRGEIIDAHILCKETIFTSEGLSITKVKKEKIIEGLAFLNSIVAQLTINQYCGQHKQVGYVNKLPVPKIPQNLKSILFENVNKIIGIKRKWSSFDETTLDFSYPLFLPRNGIRSLREKLTNILERYKNSEKELSERIERNDLIHIEAVTHNADDQEIFFQYLNQRPSDVLWGDMDNTISDHRLSFLCEQIASHIIGFLYARWDIHYATGEKQVPDLPDPFEPLPVCPPGILQNKSGLPAEPKDVPEDYPIRITWSGIMVNDEGHPEDILTRVREVMEVIWPDTSEQIEQEACEILGVTSLRDYFSKPGSFFADHLKRYSKSRRQAPIYWPLSTPSGSYILWLYYHRLTDQILYTCVNNFVDPKLKDISKISEELQRKTGRSREEEDALEKNLGLKLEMTDFRDELLRIAKFWKPDLNDGVQITAAPLWKLFQHRPWQNKLKETWEALEKGEYDWAHLAYAVWPARVIQSSHTDRSLAIAHDLEDDLWEEIEDGTDREGNPRFKWVPRPLSENEMVAIIQKKTNKR